MGSDSPAALLDMLAEVASQTLHSEKKRTKSLLTSQCKPKTDIVKRKTQEASFNVPQLLSMPASQLVKQFSIFTSDELKRQYSYTCALIPGCTQKYTSFASEGRARMSIKSHLAEHLEYLKTNNEAYITFTAKSVNYRNHKVNSHSKKARLQQSKKPQETLNKENKNVALEKSTNYLRNILLNDPSFKEAEKHKTVEKSVNSKKLQTSEQKETDKVDFKVLGDHSYFERLKDEVPNGKEASSVNILSNSTGDENIVFMVVGTDSVHMKEYTHIKQDIQGNINQNHQNLPAVYLPEVPWSDESSSKNTEATTTSKPKGKAKFIGTSKEEREMALAFMDRIKKKGNPTGNNLECRICNPPRSFTAPTTLVSHYRSHAGIKPYECRICRSVFTRRHSLKYHMLIHQNQTRFTCADCGKKFRHPSHFREHRRRHTGEAPFGCDDCGQRFKTRNTYKRHLKTRHGKVLTTTGELLYLSEEDFQKVRTNRKKKNDVKEQSMDEDLIASTTICYQDGYNQGDVTGNSNGEYIITKGDEGHEDWENEEVRSMIKKEMETYEESHLYKTETIETEIPVDNIISDRNGNNIQERYTNKIDENFRNGPYDRLQMIQDNGVIEEQALIYEDIDEAPSYIKVQYTEEENEMTDEGSNVVEYERGRFLRNNIASHIQLIEQNEGNYCEDIVYNQAGERVVSYVMHYAEEIQPESPRARREDDKGGEGLIVKENILNYEGRCLELLQENRDEETESVRDEMGTVEETQEDLSEGQADGRGVIEATKESYQSVEGGILGDKKKESRYISGIIVQNKCASVQQHNRQTRGQQTSREKFQRSA